MHGLYLIFVRSINAIYCSFTFWYKSSSQGPVSSFCEVLGDMYVYIDTGAMSKYPCSKKNYSMKTVVNLEKIYRLGGRKMFSLQCLLYLIQHELMFWRQLLGKFQNSVFYQHMRPKSGLKFPRPFSAIELSLSKDILFFYKNLIKERFS